MVGTISSRHPPTSPDIPVDTPNSWADILWGSPGHPDHMHMHIP